jgi:hypothetical protein
MNKVTCIKCHCDICLHRVSSAALERHECDGCFYYDGGEEDYFDLVIEEGEEYADPACTEMYMEDYLPPPPGKQLEFINHLPEHEHETCSICLTTFGEDRDQIVRFCGEKPHLFHEKCLVNWLKRSETCPLCRQ